MATRDTWVSNLGFVLAAVGSAAGLGNIWRFPWLTAGNGGSAFLAVYLAIVVSVGVPGLLAEFVLGRRGRQTPMGALRSLTGSRWGSVLGAFNVLTTLLILSFYSVVGGWILRYTLVSPTGAYFAQPQQYFGAIGYGFEAVGFHLLFLGIVAGIVFFGVNRGIERVSKVMLPAVVVLLVGLAAWTATQPGTAAGYAFYLGFDGEYLFANFASVLGPAAGQALFTLSVGAGTMLTYASYIDEDSSLPRDTIVIAVSNTFIGVLAGLVVIPLLFSQGVDPGQGGPGALFVGLAAAFESLPGGRVVATAFFAAVLMAAVTSAISLLETPVATLVDAVGMPRRRATLLISGVLALTGTGLSLSAPIFQFVSGTVADLMLSVGLFAFLVIVGWMLREDAIAEFRAGAGRMGVLAPSWLFTVSWLLPVVVLFSLSSTLGSLVGVSLDLGSRVAVAVVLTFVCRAVVAVAVDG
ncbi:sodium-dependent transporter [Halolamina salifodinae]|uniref:NSS family neurotransmitter:Na+ symporter n=1 Tax=Halolamina salifodinae TaxID=1202767 RepID=A0A8T4GW33_9EURY|nr:sodium-dependent transporter [Halolamina salifodinae]MBP1987197.1 NSS family neurotransmitter:Na+ symporter [Halolamina salifodinae]